MTQNNTVCVTDLLSALSDSERKATLVALFTAHAMELGAGLVETDTVTRRQAHGALTAIRTSVGNSLKGREASGSDSDDDSEDTGPARVAMNKHAETLFRLGEHDRVSLDFADGTGGRYVVTGVKSEGKTRAKFTLITVSNLDRAEDTREFDSRTVADSVTMASVILRHVRKDDGSLAPVQRGRPAKNA